MPQPQKVLVTRIKLSPHPQDQNMKVGAFTHPELAGLTVVVGDHYDDGILGFYVPENAVVPEPLLEDMWLIGRLAGAQRNRVKARHIKGVASDGLFYGSEFWKTKTEWLKSRNWNPAWKEGDDVTAETGITFVTPEQYEPVTKPAVTIRDFGFARRQIDAAGYRDGQVLELDDDGLGKLVVQLSRFANPLIERDPHNSGLVTVWVDTRRFQQR